MTLLLIDSWHARCALECPGGRYHVCARGNQRREIVRDDSDRFHFLELLSELGQRFGARVHEQESERVWRVEVGRD